jgi:ADP-ribose pyrophosphatase YjhB (NUDIX family)
MARQPIPTYMFALVVVRRGDQFLLVNEKDEQGWYLPAGGVEPGERFADAAAREALEESGVPIVLEGVLRVEHTIRPGGARLRVFFLARPADETAPRTAPNEESLGAGWFRLDEVESLRLRGDEVREWLEYVARGGAVYPLAVIATESTPPSIG